MSDDPTIQHWSIPGAEGQPIFGSTHLPLSTTATRGVMLICHGFKGYKDYGFLPWLAHAAARQGFIAHRFNFSHSGMTQNPQTFERPDLFERDTWGKQIHDLQTAAAASASGQLPGGATADRPQVWFGHSRGGVAIILAAARVFDGAGMPGTPKPVGLIPVAAPDAAMRLDPDQIDRLKRRGYLESPSVRTGQALRIGKPWFDEIEQDPQAFDPLLCIARVRCPVLLLHGDRDTTVSVDASHRLAAAAGQRASLRILPGGSHTFASPNPLPLDQTPPPLCMDVINAACDFAAGLY